MDTRDEFLNKLIQPGDGIENHTGAIFEARSHVSERFGTCYYHAMVSIETENFIVPIHVYSIRAIWRYGVCIWRRGESLMQKRLFEDVA